MDVLQRIKRLVLQRKLRFTEKARFEMDLDGLDEYEVGESIVSAKSIAKTLKSTSPYGGRIGEKLYVIQGISHQGEPIYTKGRFGQEGEDEVFYVLVSAKTDRFGA